MVDTTNNSTTVFCFDRDHTVSTSPPTGQHEAVPLSWVKYLAHGRSDVDVWATGNQKLCSEDVIPGDETAIELWQERFDGDIFDEYERLLSTGRLRRQDRVRLIADVYDAADVPTDAHYVIDDAELSILLAEGIEHFYPWHFVDVIDRDAINTSIPDELPFCDEPVHSNACSCGIDNRALSGIEELL